MLCLCLNQTYIKVTEIFKVTTNISAKYVLNSVVFLRCKTAEALRLVRANFFREKLFRISSEMEQTTVPDPWKRNHLKWCQNISTFWNAISAEIVYTRPPDAFFAILMARWPCYFIADKTPLLHYRKDFGLSKINCSDNGKKYCFKPNMPVSMRYMFFMYEILYNAPFFENTGRTLLDSFM